MSRDESANVDIGQRNLQLRADWTLGFYCDGEALEGKRTGEICRG